MKQYLLTKSVGRVALHFRDKVSLLYAAYTSAETVGTLANDLLATKLLTRICQPAATFVDVGAHIGSVVAEVKYRTPSARLVAIEAVPEKAFALKKHFPFVELHDCAVGEADGETSFFVNTKESGYSSLGKPQGRHGSAVTEIRVRVRKMDDIVRHADVDVLKIDVEGAELGVLRGGANIVESCRPLVMFESGPQADDGLGYTKEELFDFFASRNYLILLPNRLAHDSPGLTLQGFEESHWYPRRTTNYFAVPDDRKVEFMDRARRILKKS